MKKMITRLTAALGIAVLSASCSTTYDAYGRPVTSVDPAAATAGVIAAGLIGYALADDDNHRGHRSSHRSHRGHYDQHRSHGHGYAQVSSYGGYCR